MIRMINLKIREKRVVGFYNNLLRGNKKRNLPLQSHLKRRKNSWMKKTCNSSQTNLQLISFASKNRKVRKGRKFNQVHKIKERIVYFFRCTTRTEKLSQINDFIQ